jgi:hypothetical protein
LGRPGATDVDPLPAVPPSAPATHPVRDALLVASFFATLVAFAAFDPLHGRQLHTENRALAPWPTPELSRDWFARFDAAFSDRFAARNALIALQHAIAVVGFHSSPVSNVVLGRDRWLYFAGEDGHTLDRHFRGVLPFGDDLVAGLRDELERRRQYLAARGIAYIVTVAPDKATIYPEHLPAWIQRMRTPTPFDRTVALLRKDPALRFVDLRGPLLAAKKDRQVYFRTDSHWNYLGAVVAYEALMREVQRAVGTDRLPAIAPPDMPPYVEGVDRYRGDLAQMLGSSSRYDEPDFAPLGKVLGNASHRCARRIDGGKDEGFEIYACARAPDLRAVVYRDSMAIPLIPLLSENFRRVVYVSSRRLDPSLIEREHPDVVIEEFVERNLHATAAFPMAQ